MINKKKILAIIPARSGSKGLPNKNIKKLIDKPLIAWTLEEALKSKYIDEIIVSSDSKKILDISKKYKNIIQHLRSKKLSQDNTKIVDVILNILISYKEYDYIVLLQPTSPFKKINDIDLCLRKTIKQNYKSVASVHKVKNNVEWFFGINKKNNSSYFRGNVSGKVIDIIDGKKLEFANISIVNTKWNKVIEGTISNEDGKFNFSGILIGDYILQIKYLGYKLSSPKDTQS